MNSSANPNPARRRVAGERGRPRSAGSEPVTDTSAPTESAPKTVPTKTSPVKAQTTKNAGATSRRASWLVAGLALLLASSALVTSLVLWRAAEDRRTLANNQTAAASAAGVIAQKLLGYDYKSFDQHTTEVSALLTGGFKNEFVQAATNTIKPLAVENQAVVVAKASEVSVMSTPNQSTVKILAFVDQTTTSAKLERAQIDQNRVILTMTQVDGRWLVSKVEAF